MTNQKDRVAELEELMFSLPLQISGVLLRALHVDEKDMKGVHRYTYENVKACYIFSVVSEVIAVWTSCIKAKDFIELSEKDIAEGKTKLISGDGTISTEWMSHIFHKSFKGEFDIHYRKMQEFLCDLILFSRTSDDSYFKLFFAVDELTDILFANLDIEEFFGKTIDNFQYQADKLFVVCDKLMQDVDSSKCWFLRNRDSIDFSKISHPSRIKSSYRDKFREALMISSASERIVLGPTYKVGYSGPSQAAHGIVSEYIDDYTVDSVKGSIQRLNLIFINILDRAFEIMQIDYPEDLKPLVEQALDNQKSEEMLHPIVKKDLNIGDIVVMGEKSIGEILDSELSKYDYISYHIKYLINPLTPESLDDWFPPKYIGRRLLDKRNLGKFFIDNPEILIVDKSLGGAITNQDDKFLYESAKKYILYMCERGRVNKIK